MCNCKKSIQNYEYDCKKATAEDKYDLWHQLRKEIFFILEREFSTVTFIENNKEKHIPPLRQLRDILECKFYIERHKSLKFLDRNIFLGSNSSKTIEMLTIIDALGYEFKLIKK